MGKPQNILSHEREGQELIENFPVSFFSHAEAIYHLQEVGIDLKRLGLLTGCKLVVQMFLKSLEECKIVVW